MIRTIILLGSLLFLAGCAGSAYRLPQVNAAEVQAMEQKLASENKPLKVYKRSDKQSKQILANITKRLTKNAKPLCEYAGYPACRFNVKYSADDEINAYASGNYDITIKRGLMQYLKDNDAIAAVVGHEMGHHLANHLQEKQQNAAAGAAVAGIFTAVLLGAANANNPYYNPNHNQQTIEDMMEAGAHIGMLSYSKEQEREADLLATYLLSRAGYNLERAQNIMVVLAKTAGEGSSNLGRSAFLDSHPAGMERVVSWQKTIEEIKGNKSKLPYSIDTQENQSLKDQKPKDKSK